ncbi:phosphatase PAP2-related protein [Candidatus Kapaibacterium sp.]
MLSRIKSNWVNELSNGKYNYQVYISFVLVAFSLFLFTRFLNFVEDRPGVILPDPILQMFSPIDISWFTFAVMYSSVIIAILSLIPSPKLLILGLQSYTVMLIIRTVAMYSIPLEAPATILRLIDPMVSEVGVGKLMTKDLFFSGHTATIFIMFLVSSNKLYKNLFLIATIFIGFAVLVQHVHYTVDVIAAPFFAYSSYKIVIYINKKFNSLFK